MIPSRYMYVLFVISKSPSYAVKIQRESKGFITSRGVYQLIERLESAGFIEERLERVRDTRRRIREAKTYAITSLGQKKIDSYRNDIATRFELKPPSPPKKDHRMNLNPNLLVLYALKGGQKNTTEISNVIDRRIDPAKVGTVCRQLLKNGYIDSERVVSRGTSVTNNGRAYYWLTAKGQSALKSYLADLKSVYGVGE